MGGLDLLILSSGTGELKDDLDFKIERQVIDTNVSGFTYITNCAFDLLDAQGFGHGAAISAVGGLRGRAVLSCIS